MYHFNLPLIKRKRTKFSKKTQCIQVISKSLLYLNCIIRNIPTHTRDTHSRRLLRSVVCYTPLCASQATAKVGRLVFYYLYRCTCTMSTSWKSVLKLSSLTTGAGLAGWFAGKNYERHWGSAGQQLLRLQENDGRRSIAFETNVKSMPGLPIFGTVSAASPIIPVDESADMGAKLAVPESRVSQVGRGYL